MQVEEAIKTAVEYVQKLFPGSDYRLEEVERGDDGGFVITVSFRAPGTGRELLNFGGGATAVFEGKKAAVGIDPTRLYKDVGLDKGGDVKFARMRQIVVG